MAGMAYVPLAISNQTIWAYWNQTTASTVVIPNDTVWAHWNQAITATTAATSFLTVATTSVNVAWTSWNTAYEETQEQRQARERAEAQAALRRQEAEQERVVARDRALELLGYCLTSEQMASYRQYGWFEVISSKGRRWRIRARGQSGNVDLMPEIGEEREASYCAHPPGYLPDADAHLAQALTLVTDEDAFLRVANCHYRRPTVLAA